MDLDVAQCARLLIVSVVGIHHRGVNAGRIGVALQAEKVDVAVLQHTGIWPPMREVARAASLYLRGRVLKHEGSLLVRVALEANRVPRIRGPYLAGQMIRLCDPARPVLVVAIGAPHQTLIDAMVKRHIEFGLLLQVAGIAKLGRRLG